MEILWLSEKDASELVSVEEAIPAVEEAFAALARGQAQMPSKIYLTFPAYNGDLRAMPAYLPSEATRLQNPYAVVKVVNSHPDNPAKGLPTVAGVLVLTDPRTGMPLALMGAGHLTDARTGAAGAVAVKHLARKDSAVVGLVGCGRQAATQLRAIRSVMTVREVLVAGRTIQEAEVFCRKYSMDATIRFVPCATVQAACAADIVVTTTPSRQPVVKAEWVRPGTHINAIGADAPGKQELESRLLTKALVFVDLEEQAFHSGEVNVPLSDGTLKRQDIAGNLGEVVIGAKKGRASQADITIFDSTGLAIQDAAIGALAYEKALAAGRGTKLAFA